MACLCCIRGGGEGEDGARERGSRSISCPTRKSRLFSTCSTFPFSTNISATFLLPQEADMSRGELRPHYMTCRLVTRSIFERMYPQMSGTWNHATSLISFQIYTSPYLCPRFLGASLIAPARRPALTTHAFSPLYLFDKHSCHN